MENQFCPSCGASLPAGAAFCGNCGAKIAQEAPVNEAPMQAEAPVNEPNNSQEAAPAAAEPVQSAPPAEPEAPAAPEQPLEQPQAQQPQANGFVPGQQAGYTAPPNYGATQPQQSTQPSYGAAPQQPAQPGYGAPQTGGQQPPYAPNQAYGGQPQGQQAPYSGGQVGGQPSYAPNGQAPNQAPYGQQVPGQAQYGQAYTAPQQPQAAKKKMKPLTLVLIILGSLIVIAGIVFAGIKLFGGGSGISIGGGSLKSSSPSGLTLDKMFALDPSWTRDDIEETYGEPDAVRTGDFEYYTYDDVKINDEEGFVEVWFDDDDNADFAIWECDVDDDDVDDFVDALISYMDKKYGDHEVDNSSSFHTDYSWDNPNISYGSLEIQVDKEASNGEVTVVIWNFM